MAMTEQPITRSELREELSSMRTLMRDEMATLRSEFREELKHYATKADLAEVRGDIKAMRVLIVATITGVGIVLGALNIILQLIG